MSVYDVLMERGFNLSKCPMKTRLRIVREGKITFYIGFGPHRGQSACRPFHRPDDDEPYATRRPSSYRLLGGGTGMVGDPSGKDEMRKMLTPEFIAHNIACFKKQMSRFIDFGEDKAIIVNNADWLLDLNYVQLLREVGVHFTVNRMLAAECFKKRWEKGLTFFEFNYMIMQGYDFWKLHHDHNCIMELGGDDQWSNMLAGVELIRRKDQKPAYCMTCKLLTTSDGRKIGQTEKGSSVACPEKTSPYDFYQYWRNVADSDVKTACPC